MHTHLHAALLLALCTGTAAAQTLTDATSIPAVGYTETRTYHNSSNASGWALTGTGNTWDATAVTPFGITATVTYRAPGDSPFAGTYPTTTLCAERVQNGNTEWRHYIVDNAHAEMIGVSAEAVVDGRTYCNFPFTIGGTFTDSWTINGNNFSDTYTYVASGSVQAPWGTIPNVVLFETSGGFSYYLYLASNLLDPIGTYTPGFGLDLWQVELGMGMADAPALHVGLRPNPTSDELVLSMPLHSGFTYTLLDASGSAVRSGTSASDRAVLDLRNCAPGVYHAVAVDVRGRRATGNVVVVK
jgi:hypothetical protein